MVMILRCQPVEFQLRYPRSLFLPSNQEDPKGGGNVEVTLIRGMNPHVATMLCQRVGGHLNPVASRRTGRVDGNMDPAQGWSPGGEPQSGPLLSTRFNCEKS